MSARGVRRVRVGVLLAVSGLVVSLTGTTAARAATAAPLASRHAAASASLPDGSSEAPANLTDGYGVAPRVQLSSVQMVIGAQTVTVPLQPGPSTASPPSAMRAALPPPPSPAVTVVAGPDWINDVSTVNPGQFSGASMAYDRANGADVFFGGMAKGGALNGTTWLWEVQGGVQDWYQQSPPTSPAARAQAVMAYDPLVTKTFLFGGRGSSGALGDTWSWDGTTWSHLSPATSPPATYGASMVWDQAINKLVLFGGEGSCGCVGAGTWTFDGTTWAQLSPATSPPARQNAAMAFDYSASDVVLFGGDNGLGTANGGTWTFDGTTWAQRTPYASPTARSGVAASWDASLNRVVLTGGKDQAGSYLSDSWVYDPTAATWQVLQQNIGIGGTFQATLAPAANGNGVVTTGGVYDAAGDTWGWIENLDWNHTGSNDGNKAYTVKLDDRLALRVDLGNKNLSVVAQGLSYAGTGLSLSSYATYNYMSNNWFEPQISQPTLVEGPGGRWIIDGVDNSTNSIVFTPNGSAYNPPDGVRATLVYNSTPNTYTLTDNAGQQKTTFPAPAPATGSVPYSLASSVTDRNGDTITISGTTATDTRGRTITETINTGASTRTFAGSDGRSWVETYNSSGRDTKIVDPAGRATLFAYDSTTGLLDKITDPNSNVTLIGYNTAYFPDSVTRVTDTVHQTGPTTTFATNAVAPGAVIPAGTTADHETVVTDPNLNATTYIDDFGGQTIQTVDALGHTRGATYNTNRNQLGDFDGNGNQSQGTYSAEGYWNQLTGTASPSGTGQTAASGDATYNVGSQSASGPNPVGTSVAGYNYLASSGVDAVGNCTNSSYDNNGNTTTAWSGLPSTGTGPTRTCNAPTGAPPAGAVQTVTTYQGDTKAGGGTTTCGAATGEVCSVTNGLGGTTTYGYDSLGQATTVTPPTPRHPTTTTYDTASRVATVTDGAGRTAKHTYDNDDRLLVTNTNPTTDPNCTTAADCVTNTYDNNGNLTQRLDGTGTTTTSVDALNRQTARYLPGSPTNTCATPNDTGIHYTYRAASNLKAYCDAGGTVTYTYDNATRLTGLADPSGSCTPGAIVQPCTTYAYDSDNHRITTTWPASTGAVQCAGYDNAGGLINLVAVKGTCTTNTNGSVTSSGTPLVHLNYHYATLANGTADTAVKQYVVDAIAGTTTSYTYDTQGRLTCSTTSAIANCSTSGYKYVYDSDGNITARTLNGTTTNTTYNTADETTTGAAAYNAAGDQTTTTASTALTYNAYAQTSAMQLTGGTLHNYGYTGTTQDGLTTAAATGMQISSLGVTATTTAGTTTYYSRTPSGALATIRSGGASYYYLTDANGSVTGLFNSAGVRAATYTYDPYGQLTSGTPSGIGATNQFRFDSGYQTTDGLYHFGARYYDPATGRWTQLDPSGKSQGYVFVGDQPVNETDPTGECGYLAPGMVGPPSTAPCTYGVSLGVSSAYGSISVALNIQYDYGPAGVTWSTFQTPPSYSGFFYQLTGGPLTVQTGAPGTTNISGSFTASFCPGIGPFSGCLASDALNFNVTINADGSITDNSAVN